MRNFAPILALAFVLAGCDEPEPTEAPLPDAALCAFGGIIEGDPPYDWCIQLNRTDVDTRDRMAKGFGIELIDCLRPNGGMVWAIRQECAESMGISIDH